MKKQLGFLDTITQINIYLLITIEILIFNAILRIKLYIFFVENKYILLFRSNRSKQYSERNKMRNASPYESVKFTNHDLNSSDNSPDSIESRVEALKQANHYLRMEVENACKMINSSVLNKSKMEEEFLSMPKVKYPNLTQFDLGNHKHKVSYSYLNEY